MDLKEVQISEIKNLNLVYVFTTDSIFKKGTNKYVGARVVFENNTRSLALDYKDKHFEKFIRRILERYNKEKDKRKIILLGELTKKLMSDSSFAVLEKVQKDGVQTVGIPSFNTSNRNIKEESPYLKQVMKMILMVYKNYEVVKVDSIDGFNKKYIVNYSVGPVKKMMPIIISQREDGVIDFKLKRIDDVQSPISGTLVSDGGLVDIKWQSDNEELQGSLLYDTQNGIVERKVTSNGQTIIYDENKDTLLEEDASLIKFYFDLCGLEIPSNITKVDDTSFLLSQETTLNDDEKEILYSNIGAQISVEQDEVRIKYRVKNCFSKYNNQINTVLDEEKEEITFKRIDLEPGYGIIVEVKTEAKDREPSFNHRIYEIDSEVDLRKPFEFTSTYHVDSEIKTMEKARQYVKQKKGGNK